MFYIYTSYALPVESSMATIYLPVQRSFFRYSTSQQLKSIYTEVYPAHDEKIYISPTFDLRNCPRRGTSAVLPAARGRVVPSTGTTNG